MAQYSITNLADLHLIIDSYGDPGFSGYVYRGVKSVDYELVPKVGRLRTFKGEPFDEPNERYMLEIFKREAIPYLPERPANDWEWLAIGQHCGLPTRLLDWTRNPLAACYFAVEKEHDGYSVMFAYRTSDWIDVKANPDPFALNEVRRFLPDHVTQRIKAQSGLFTVHPQPQEPLRSNQIDRLTIPQVHRNRLKRDLYKFGVHAATLFPDLDGLSRYVCWLRTNLH